MITSTSLLCGIANFLVSSIHKSLFLPLTVSEAFSQVSFPTPPLSVTVVFKVWSLPKVLESCGDVSAFALLGLPVALTQLFPAALSSCLGGSVLLSALLVVAQQPPWPISLSAVDLKL